MFYECRILDKAGKVKKVVSAKVISKKYWQDVEQERKMARTGKGQATKRLFVKTEEEDNYLALPMPHGSRVKFLGEDG